MGIVALNGSFYRNLLCHEDRAKALERLDTCH